MNDIVWTVPSRRFLSVTHGRLYIVPYPSAATYDCTVLSVVREITHYSMSDAYFHRLRHQLMSPTIVVSREDRKLCARLTIESQAY